MTVRAFSDAYPVDALLAQAPLLYAGRADGLFRFDLRSGVSRPVDLYPGMPFGAVAVVAAGTSGALWVGGEAGIAHGREGQPFHTFVAPPVGRLRALAEGPDETLYAAGDHGLAKLDGERWQPLMPDVAVRALVRSGDALWLSTDRPGLLRVIGDRLESFGAEQGCAIGAVRSLAPGVAPGTIYALGAEPSRTRVAYFDGGRFHSFGASPDPRATALVAALGGVVLVAPSAAFALSPLGGRELDRGAIALRELGPSAGAPPRMVGSFRSGGLTAPPAPRPGPPPAPAPGPTGPGPRAGAVAPATRSAPLRLYARALRVTLPASATALAGDELSLFAGTADQGVVRYAGGGAAARLRRSDVLDGGRRLTVACATDQDCYVATGGGRAWRFDGARLAPAEREIDPEEGARVLAFARDARGNVVALHRGPREPSLRISRVDGRRWSPVAVQDLRVPEGAPDLAFVAYDPEDRLWIGLRYRDHEGEERTFGVAQVWLASGKVVYHRPYPTGRAPARALAVPQDVNAVAFKGDDVWFAARSGAVRVSAGKVRVFTEADGLWDEYLDDIVEGLGGELWVASLSGLGRFDGARWRFAHDGPLAVKARALARDARGAIWVATVRGVVRLEGGQVEAYGPAAGLLEESVRDVAVDARERVWALGERSLTLLQRR